MELANADLGARRCSRTRADAEAGAAARFVPQYDVIILDCPPNLSLLGVNALVAADGLIVPVTPQPLAVEGLVSLLASVETVRLAAEHARTTCWASCSRLSIPTHGKGPLLIKQLRERHGADVFRTEILASRALEEAPMSDRDRLPVRPTIEGRRRVSPAGRGSPRARFAPFNLFRASALVQTGALMSRIDVGVEESRHSARLLWQSLK